MASVLSVVLQTRHFFLSSYSCPSASCRLPGLKHAPFFDLNDLKLGQQMLYTCPQTETCRPVSAGQKNGWQEDEANRCEPPSGLRFLQRPHGG